MCDEGVVPTDVQHVCDPFLADTLEGQDLLIVQGFPKLQGHGVERDGIIRTLGHLRVVVSEGKARDLLTDIWHLIINDTFAEVDEKPVGVLPAPLHSAPSTGHNENETEDLEARRCARRFSRSMGGQANQKPPWGRPGLCRTNYLYWISEIFQ